MSGLLNTVGQFVSDPIGFLGTKKSTSTQTAAPPTPEEAKLIDLNTQLAQKQLANLDQLAPFQQELISQSLAEMKRQGAISSAIDEAVTPEQQAELAKQDFERAQRLGPIQEELLQRQLDEVRRGGAATPEQLQQIKDATDAAITAGSADIDLSTQRGIGLIADELANSRGLRLSDSPITSEAALLARGGEDQKANLIKSLRAGEATARLNFPLAASQITSGINLATQNVADAAKAFQADLRQRAFQNRLALSGQASQSGIGVAGVGGGAGVGTLSALTSVRGRSSTGTLFDPTALLNNIGAIGRGIGMASQ